MSRRLAELHREAADCKRCDLWTLGTQTVFGEGNARELMLVGEQPGDVEDVKGHPFVGPAGKLLRKLLVEAKLAEEEMYLTNAVKRFKWRPSAGGKKRIHDKPNWTEVNACGHWLALELAAVEPKLVVCLGATAAQALLGRSARVGALRGKPVELEQGIPALVTIHPSAVLRAGEERDTRRSELLEDLRPVGRSPASAVAAAESFPRLVNREECCMDQAVLFDRDRAEQVDDWESLVGRLGRKSLLWIDLSQADEHELDNLTRSLELEAESRRRLSADDDGPYFGDFGDYMHVRAFAPSAKGSSDLCAVDCLVSEHWLVTSHTQDVEVIEQFRQRAADGSGDTGRLDGLEFLATMLEWVLNEYMEAFDRIEDDLAEIEGDLLESSPNDPDRCLRELVTLRREIRDLRAALVSHREVFLALTRPELEDIADSGHAERFVTLRSRVEDTIQSARDCRDSVVGSFDVLHARTEQRTNEIMKVLTLASMLFLPGALIAGVLGMNFRVGLFDYDVLFWVVLGAIFGMMGAVLVAARLRDWI